MQRINFIQLGSNWSTCLSLEGLYSGIHGTSLYSAPSSSILRPGNSHSPTVTSLAPHLRDKFQEVGGHRVPTKSSGRWCILLERLQDLESLRRIETTCHPTTQLISNYRACRLGGLEDTFTQETMISESMSWKQGCGIQTWAIWKRRDERNWHPRGDMRKLQNSWPPCAASGPSAPAKPRCFTNEP